MDGGTGFGVGTFEDFRGEIQSISELGTARERCPVRVGFGAGKAKQGTTRRQRRKVEKKASSASRIRGKDRERKKRNKIYELVHKGAGTPDGRSDGGTHPPTRGQNLERRSGFGRNIAI